MLLDILARTKEFANASNVTKISTKYVLKFLLTQCNNTPYKFHYQLIIANNPADRMKRGADFEAVEDDAVIDRILFFVDSSRIEGNKVLNESFQINGVVVSGTTWDLLSVPSPYINYGIGHVFSFFSRNEKELKKSIKAYKVYDGTVVTLYYHRDMWRLSSANSIDINNHTLIAKDKTFATLFEEALPASCRLNSDVLNKCMSYSIAFRHPEHHLFHTDDSKPILLSVFNLLTKKYVGTESHAKMLNIAVQKPIDIEHMAGVMTTDAVIKKNKNALIDYIENKGEFHYGYIFHDTEKKCRYMYPSSLLLFIKENMYASPCMDRKGFAPIEYAGMRAFLSNELHTPFIALFPQFLDQYHAYSVFLRRLIGSITVELVPNACKYLAGLKTLPDTIEEHSSYKTLLTEISARLGSIDANNVQGKHEILKDIIVDSICTSDNAVLILQLFNNVA